MVILSVSAAWPQIRPEWHQDLVFQRFGCQQRRDGRGAPGPLVTGPARHADREPLERRYDRQRKLQKQYPDREKVITTAMDVPKWYLKPELRSFDHIHPNTEGHRVIAKETCGQLPASWGCDCAALDALAVEKGRLVLPKDGRR